MDKSEDGEYKCEFVMKTARIPAIVFALLLIGYVLFLLCTVSLLQLPQRMATHFDISGQPNGWMSRSSAVVFQGAIGLILPLIIAAAFYSLRLVPTRWINCPRRDFWFAPERRDETCTYLSRQGLWLASLEVGLQGVLWYQLIENNSTTIPHLSSSAFLVTLGVFVVAMVAWVMRLIRHFAKAV